MCRPRLLPRRVASLQRITQPPAQSLISTKKTVRDNVTLSLQRPEQVAYLTGIFRNLPLAIGSRFLRN